ncbi:hypothetical protein M0813_28335 [Anaeramoeba flamelloides]|uniref:PSI domain-containing protein n=1 Tax=Anaeramoeba flamelloides TaxID=1746091 RepID=A0ABQ8XTF5_9EUKA|nr:hypothetical protein M0813_28335 [Anaeramoeba flamelloides]
MYFVNWNFALIVLCIIGIFTSAEEDCEVYTIQGCESCLTHYIDRSCGWCNNTNTCLKGTAQGPDTGECTDSWNFGPEGDCSIPTPTPTATPTPTPTPTATPTPDPNECSQSYKDCNLCVSHNKDRNCGWCKTDKTCYSGNEESSLDGKCKDENWIFGENSQCIPSECKSYDDSCELCLTHHRDRSCGWCSQYGLSYSCYRGNVQGPYNITCSGDWYYGPNSKCSGTPPSPTTSPTSTPTPLPTPSPFPSNECGIIYSDCLQCISHYVDRKCGWCEESNSCESGNDAGPLSGKCRFESWKFGPSGVCFYPSPSSSPSPSPSPSLSPSTSASPSHSPSVSPSSNSNFDPTKRSLSNIAIVLISAGAGVAILLLLFAFLIYKRVKVGADETYGSINIDGSEDPDEKNLLSDKSVSDNNVSEINDSEKPISEIESSDLQQSSENTD